MRRTERIALRQLTLMFVEHDADGGREIETTNLFRHGKSEGIGVGRIEEMIGQAGRFTSKDEHILWLKLGIPERPFRESRKEKQPSTAQFFGQVVPIDRVAELQVLPVIEPSASHSGVIDAKRGWSNDPQFGPDGDAGPADVSRILRDFRLIEDHVGGRARVIMGVGWVDHRIVSALAVGCGVAVGRDTLSRPTANVINHDCHTEGLRRLFSSCRFKLRVQIV